jgi:hypothetical protein
MVYIYVTCDDDLSMVDTYPPIFYVKYPYAESLMSKIQFSQFSNFTIC